MDRQEECKCEKPILQPQTKQCGKCKLYIDRVRHILLTNPKHKQPCTLQSVAPRLFYVVEEIEEGVWEQITVGLNSYEEAKQYKERWDGKHPRAFIVSSLNEV